MHEEMFAIAKIHHPIELERGGQDVAIRADNRHLQRSVCTDQSSRLILCEVERRRRALIAVLDEQGDFVDIVNGLHGMALKRASERVGRILRFAQHCRLLDMQSHEDRGPQHAKDNQG